MRIRASFTIENSVIIPVFTFIIVSLIAFLLYLHDCVVVKNVLLQSAIQTEKTILEDHTVNMEAMVLQTERQVKSYIQEKTVSITNISMTIRVSENSIVAECEGQFQWISFMKNIGKIYKKEEIQRSYPPDYIRKVRAIQKTIT